MNFPTVPTPDSVIFYYLKLIFGSSSVVVAGVAFSYAIWQWVKLARDGRGKIVLGARWVAGMLPLARAIGFIISIVMLPLQLLWVYLSYVMGNGISYFFEDRPEWTGKPDWSIFIDTMRWDWVSQVYVVAAVVTLAIGYWGSFSKKDDGGNAGLVLLGLPLLPIAAVTFLGVLVSGVVNVMYVINDDGVSAGKVTEAREFLTICVAILGIVVAYFISSIVATTSGPKLLAEIWRPRRGPTMSRR